MQRKSFSLIDWFIIPNYDTPKGINSGNLIFDEEKCTGCGTCVQICPGGCLLTDKVDKMDLVSGKAKGNKHGLPRVAKTLRGATLCITCFDCGAACPHDAITIDTHFDPTRFYKRITQTDDMIYPKRY